LMVMRRRGPQWREEFRVGLGVHIDVYI
jgi:hypothetical protein